MKNDTVTDEDLQRIINPVRTISGVQLVIELTNEKIRNKEHLVFWLNIKTLFMNLSFVEQRKFTPQRAGVSGTVWEEKNNKLYKKFQFKDFSEAFAFMTR